jgi:radical SAM protein with 4Fe4S-binding SPASM domain
MHLFNQHKAELNYVMFEVTQRCNLKCVYCYNHWKRDNPEEKGSSTSYNEALKTLKRLFKQANIKHVTFTGGEPMLMERIEELVLFCRMKGASVSLITNGNTGSEDQLLQLIKIGVEPFELPFHSNNPAIHDRMTGVSGSWAKAKNSIQFITQAGGYVVPVIVVTKHNFNTISATLKELNKMGHSRIMLNRYNIGGKGINSPEAVLPTIEQLNEAFGQANETAMKLNLTISSNVCTPHCVINPQLYRSIGFTNCSMDVSKRPLTLTASGELRFCNHSPTVLGNIFNESVKAILENGAKIGTITSRPTLCISCNKYELCLGGCRAAAEQAGKTFFDVDPIAEKALINICC